MTDGSRVSLQLYEDKFHEQLLAFQLPPEQAQFTALPAESLPEALCAPDKLAVVITEEELAAGFFILHTGGRIAEFYSNYSEAALVRAFLVNSPCQGRGIATAAMALLPAFVRNHLPQVREIVLTVNERNPAALALYLRAGFCDHGLRRTGGKGPQRILQYALKNNA
ncbi:MULTISPECIES: GNAT family N-acetyltransferase [unclassified Paenibacillus]|uniref:GNAT family N-acetyltransferase n=1 Tax=unclassified Paenibacillus TaxID=185978 RepID=UPI002407419F|nr:MULTISPECIES: GNAT family N-acetyltransferase [unclassified Paenibacillus]MDF9843576.1 RimJ/RimL family protein N-acetyltransferase [Paenibacillus sp. PastF-2]MDF9850164.1 RimJ/RimL family protein N-acetyltransferase [Paenibacillus sp. PastM-2]MDF9857094.1 RimJ/RimL family protein N-acetyltransferase [Paenibacillus sp. PastF-1]MDH6482365.1 RimJ/RimL family protein N-acetyltransferase [Paenibacillus sp. PastH-2]MDH6509297.1 RimJ/RimL family protein N-acetyltransferase [Paenibacillus sp. Past